MSKYRYWHETRDIGCSCTFCSCGMNWGHEIDRSGAIIRCLGEDEFQLVDGDKRWVVKNPKCLVKHPEFSFQSVMEKAQPGPKVNCHCKKCKTMNEFAEPNQEDGSYVCYECR